jgi:1,4-dihydroxy-2-naphthoate octaprenyltransferase
MVSRGLSCSHVAPQVLAYIITDAFEKANLSQDRDAKPKGLLWGGSRVAEKEISAVHSAPLSKLSKALLTTLRRVATFLRHVLSGLTVRRFRRLVEEKATSAMEEIRRIATLSTLMAVLAIVLFVSIVLGYI